MTHTSEVKTYRAGGRVGLSLRLAMAFVVLGFLCLFVASPATAFGPANVPGLGQPPVPNAGWEAQEIGGIQPWWQMGKVAPPPSTSRPWVVPPPMYDTGPGEPRGY
jgi:hypothetical protein